MCKKKEGVEVMAAVLVHTSMLRLLNHRPSPLPVIKKKSRKHARYHLCTVCVLLLASPDLPEVELKLLALENVSVSTARLAWSAADNSVETTSSKLALEKRVNLSILLPLVVFALCVV